MSAGAAFGFKYLNVWDPFLGAQRASGEAAPFDLLEGDAPSAPFFAAEPPLFGTALGFVAVFS